ncbi:hypothetical protein PBS_24310 [Paraburkholderia sp. 2C]
MNSKHVQTFLMVSAAFFAIHAPVRANSAQPESNTGSNGIVRPAQTVSRPSADASRDDASSSVSLRAPSGE